MMKKLVLLLAIFVQHFALAQESVPVAQPENSANDVKYSLSSLDVKPDFPGGLNEFYRFVAANFKTPKVAGLRGKVFVLFTIEKDGTLTEIKSIRDIGHGTAEEAIRVLKLSPKWNPGQQNGKNVRTIYSLPITIVGKE